MHTRRPWLFSLARHEDPAPAPTPEPTPAPAPDPAADPADDPLLGPAGEKALAAMKERARAAEAAAKAAEARVREFEDRDKSDLEKAQAAAARAEAELATTKGELVRARVIAETGLSQELAEFLPAGTDEEAVRVAAAKLAAATAAPGRTGPRPDPTQGSGRPAPPPVDYRTASKPELAAEAAKYGIRLRQR